MKLKFDWQHIALLIGLPSLDAFVEVLANGGTLNAAIARHAGFVALATAVAIFKKSPAQFVTMGALLLFALVSATSACGSSTPPANAPANATQQRAQFRAAILAASAADKAAADACVALARASGDDTIRARCAAVLVPAGQQITVAAAALDAWTDTAGEIIACRLRAAVVAIISLEAVGLPANVVAAIQDADVLGAALVGVCPADAGIGG